ncbi:MAG: hypothetical protein ABF629_09595 [Sporolactobacillus sp.]|nr:hypothetical protein [Sporolactobacillus sp. STSJ-5]
MTGFSIAFEMGERIGNEHPLQSYHQAVSKKYLKFVDRLII